MGEKTEVLLLSTYDRHRFKCRACTAVFEITLEPSDKNHEQPGRALPGCPFCAALSLFLQYIDTFTPAKAGDKEKLKEWEIWAEGFTATGQSGEARLVGKATATTFREACLRWYVEHRDQAASFNPDRLTDWGCQLYDNEHEARKSFG